VPDRRRPTCGDRRPAATEQRRPAATGGDRRGTGGKFPKKKLQFKKCQKHIFYHKCPEAVSLDLDKQSDIWFLMSF